jgi:hypothetical protein
MNKYTFRPKFSAIKVEHIPTAAAEARTLAANIQGILTSCKEPYEADVTVLGLVVLSVAAEEIQRFFEREYVAACARLGEKIRTSNDPALIRFGMALARRDLGRFFLSDADLAEGK